MTLGELANTNTTLAEQQSDVLAKTAIQLVQTNYELVTQFDSQDLRRWATAFESGNILQYETLFTEQQRQVLDAFAYNLSSLRLSELPQRIEQGHEVSFWVDSHRPGRAVTQLATVAQASSRQEILSGRELAITLLENCVTTLRDYQQRQDRGEGYVFGTLDQARSSTLAQTAVDLINNVPALADQLPSNYAYQLMTSSYGELWDIHTLIAPPQLAIIDEYVQGLCRTKLTGFQQAIARGFSPLTGVPLDCPNPEAYDQAALFPSPETERLYELYMSPEEAVEMVRIQRLDLRERSEEEWAYLASFGDFVRVVQQDDQRV